MIAGLDFASPLFLGGLALVPILALLLRRDEHRRERRMAAFVDAGLHHALVIGASRDRRRLVNRLGIMGFAVGTLALAQPQCEGAPILLPRSGVDIFFVIDVSRSMRAQDVAPDRLERAKAEVSAALPALGDNRIGIIAFAGTAFVQCPLTTDVEAVRMFLAALNPESVPQGGTSLAAGLEVAHNAFLAESDGTPGRKPAGRVVVVITDGEDHEGGLEAISAKLKEAKVATMLIGIGLRTGQPIPRPRADGGSPGYLTDRAGKTIMSRMDPLVLQGIATAVGGAFVDGTTLRDFGLSELKAIVGGLEKRDLEARTRREKVDHGAMVAAWAGVLLFLHLALPQRVSSSNGRGGWRGGLGPRRGPT